VECLETCIIVFCSLNCEVVSIANFCRYWTICVWTLDFVASMCNLHFVVCSMHNAHNKFLLKFMLCEFDGFNKECEA
jgi:hypothetical protein